MNLYANGKDISNYIESVTWSGDENQLARKITVSYLYAPRSNPSRSMAVSKGERLIMEENGIQYFDGIVVREERTESGITMQSMAYDYAWYLRSKALGIYKGAPSDVVRQVCSENGIPVGNLYPMEGEVEVISTGEKSISQVIEAAYDGGDVHVYMRGNSLCIEKYGAELAGTVTGDDYVTDASYSSSAENIVNKVILLNAQDQPVGELTNGFTEYGTIQDTYKISGDEKDLNKEAGKLLKGIEESGKIVVCGNSAFQTGKAIVVEKVNSKIRGRFIIISDSHSFKGAEYSTTLGLRFDSVI